LIQILKAMEILKFINRVKAFYLYSRCINGRILKYVVIDATKKTGKKTNHMLNFIVFIALSAF